MPDPGKKESSSISFPSLDQFPSQSATGLAFDRARRAAFVQDILAPLRNQPANLLPFEQVRRELHLVSQTYRGLQEVPLEQIVGSVGRYHDFNRAFLPRRQSLRPRWQRTMRLRKRLSPVELYKVGDVYFVVDGNHRVSVARQAGASTIPAHVWEYQTRVPVESNDNLNDILLRAEYLEFLEQSRLDVNRPEQRLIFTVPGGYRKVGEEIARHREWLDRQHTYTVSFEEAATHWYDTVYTPMVEIIRDQNIVAGFPGRTEADLVAYVLRHRDELHQRWIDRFTTSAPDLIGDTPAADNPEMDEPRWLSMEAAQAFVTSVQRDWWGRIVAWVKRKLLRWEILDRRSGHDQP